MSYGVRQPATIARLITVGLLVGGVFWFGVCLWPAKPDSLEASYRNVVEQIRAGKFLVVRDQVKEISQRPGGRDPGLLLEAEIFLRGGRADAALRVLRNADQDGLYRNEILLCAGQALYRLGRFAEAVRSLREVIAATPDEVEAHRWLSAAYYDLGANHAATAELREVIRLAPNDYRPHHLMGVIYTDLESFGPASESLRVAASMSPPPEKFAEIVEQLSKCLLQLRQFEEALSCCAQVPETAAIRLCRLECLWNLNRLPEARTVLANGKTLGDRSPELSLLESQLVEESEGPEAAAAVLSKAIQEFPLHAALLYFDIQILQKLGNAAEAEARMNTFQQLQKRVELLNELSAQAESAPTDPAIRDQLAVVCESLGKAELATMWRKAADACRLAMPVSPE